MKLIIPMAGKGNRFNRYLSPKPLIELDGKPMIEHVMNYFPRNIETIFICREDHLSNTNLKQILKKISPSSRIVSITEPDLNGPAHTCSKAFDILDDNEELIINYCDFIQGWDYNKFINQLKKQKPVGAMVSFKGFHPSSLGTTLYAYLKIENNLIKQISEKKSFSADKSRDYASTGTYYFKSGKIFKQYVKQLLSKESMAVNGEYYMSLPYILMIKDKLKVMNFEIEKFICLGTPRDYEQYRFWSTFFLNYSPHSISFDNINLNVTNIFPIAGQERDFNEMGFDGPNFMLPIMNKTLIEYSFNSNPKGTKNIFIAHKNETRYTGIELFNAANSELIAIDTIDEGNAKTVIQAKDKVNPSAPVCVSNPTNILSFNERKLITLMGQDDVDIILLTFSHHECVLRNPASMGYAKIVNNIEVEYISEKQTISDNPYFDQALTGTAIYKQSKDLFDSIEIELTKSNEGPTYFLSCLNNLIHKRKIVIFEVDKFISLRNITNYKEFIYWQDYFDNLEYHPYSKILQ